jgi:hypothetical protein
VNAYVKDGFQKDQDIKNRTKLTMKFQKLLLSIIISISFVTISHAEEKKVIKGFSGGMMLHTGYQFGSDNPYNLNISSPTFGIGGCAKLHLTKHFRAGFEGYFSTAPIRKGVQSGSHNKMFWTGALADWFWQKGKLTPYIGATVAGGMETSYYLFKGDKHDWEQPQESVLHKQPFFAIDPYVGIEYAVGEALRLTLKADWLLAFNSKGLNMPMGPRIYFGFIFAH